MIGKVPTPLLERLLAQADHVDTQTVTSNVNLWTFVMSALNWQPAWLKGLFWLRGGFARLLKLRQVDVDAVPAARAAPEPFLAGDRLSFFTVVEAINERYLMLETKDTHLTAYLAFLTEPSRGGPNHFEAVTIVHYHHWTGPLYLNVIRPFHHLIVSRMIAAGARG